MTYARKPTLGVTRIGPVLTPKQWHQRGYAGAAVAAVAAQYHCDAKVCLYADQANSTSNRLYESIGFRAGADMANFALNTNH